MTKFSLEERTTCMMPQIIDSSRTHGTRPDSEDSTPSAKLCVRLLTSAFLFKVISSFSLFLSFYSLKSLKCASTTHSCRAMHAQYTWGLLVHKLIIIIIRASSSPHMYLFCVCTFSSPLYASIWLKFWPSWVAWLLCLCPMFPLVRLGHKGSTSAIGTAGTARCVPQTGWSRKLAFLREYLVGELKMFFKTHSIVHPQKLYKPWCSHHNSDMYINTCTPRERNP